jgi:hypothetical protein
MLSLAKSGFRIVAAIFLPTSLYLAALAFIFAELLGILEELF